MQRAAILDYNDNGEKNCAYKKVLNFYKIWVMKYIFLKYSLLVPGIILPLGVVVDYA